MTQPKPPAVQAMCRRHGGDVEVLRRGEAVGLRWSDVNLDTGIVEIGHTLVMVGGAVIKGTPKTRAGNPRRGTRRSGPRLRPPGKDTGGGGGRESNPPATRHAALWF